MTISAKPNVVVIGGSVSGLMAGLVVADKGCTVTVLERTPEHLFLDRGAGLGIRGDVVDFLKIYKPEEVELSTFKLPDTLVYDPDGTFVGNVPMPKQARATTWYNLVGALKRSYDLVAKREGAKTSYQYGCGLDGIVENASTGKLTVSYVREGQVYRLEDVDMVIGADGSNSAVRKAVGIDSQRSYVGYLMYRGVCPRELVSDKIRAIYDDYTVGVNSPATTTISYRMSADKLLWATYRLHPEAELDDMMTNLDGHRHPLTLLAGQMRPHNVEKTKVWARACFPPEVLELVEKGNSPSIQVMTDINSPAASFLGGKVLLMGEAVMQIRPHAFSGTLQSAYHALRIKDLIEGTIDEAEYNRTALDYSRALRDWNAKIGETLILDEEHSNFDKYVQCRASMGDMMDDLGRIRDALRTRKGTQVPVLSAGSGVQAAPEPALSVVGGI